MSAVEELCALGFERYWVSQALELTNHNKDYALEWLLSDEFKLAKQQFDLQKKKFAEKTKKTPNGVALPQKTKTKQTPYTHNNHDLYHSKDPSLQESSSKQKPKPQSQEEETEIDYELHQPDLKPKKTITDFKIGINQLLAEGTDSDDSDYNKNKKNNKNNNNQLMEAISDNMDRRPSSQIEHDEEENNDEEMQKFLQKLKNQVGGKGNDWTCHSCGIEVKGDRNECQMCNAVRPSETDWICNVCTFVNDEEDGVCQMCLHNQPSTEINNVSKHLGKFKNEQTWSCASCQYLNSKTSCCRMCGFVLGNDITPQNKQKEAIKIDVDADKNGSNKKQKNSPFSPNKHVSANSGGHEDVFSKIVNANAKWDKPLPDPPSKEVNAKVKNELNGGGQVMLMKPPKKKHQDNEDDDDDDDEEEVDEDEEESSSLEEVDDNDGVQVVAVPKRVSVRGGMADAMEPNEDQMEFDIPMMDADKLRENADMINIQKKEDSLPSGYRAQPVGDEAENSMNNNKAKELTGFEALKAMYGGSESNGNKKQKIKLKLRVGTLVDIYSSSRQDWVEGIIKEIKGDLICIVYGKHMKWLKKNSRQLRPKAQLVKEALIKQQNNQNNQNKQEVSNFEPAIPNISQSLNQHNQSPPAAFDSNNINSEFHPPPPSDPPPAFAVNDKNELMEPMKPDHFLTPKPPARMSNNNVNVSNMNQSMAAAADEFDYDVTFTTSVLGLELYPDRSGLNCIVGKCLSKTSKKFVDPGSCIVAVNDMWVYGMSYDMVRDSIKQASKYPPLKIEFRIKMNSIGKKKNNQSSMSERGYLKIKVVAGVQLKHRASYCVVQVGNARLSTREVPRDEHPEWQEMLTFKNFRPDQGKNAIVTVYDHSTILKDKKIGQTKYLLPINFNKLQRDTLELKSNKGKLSGVIILNTIIVHKSNSIRHLRKY